MTRKEHTRLTIILLSFSFFAACRGSEQPPDNRPPAITEVTESTNNPENVIPTPAPLASASIEVTVEIRIKEEPTPIPDLTLGLKSAVPAELARYLQSLSTDSGKRIDFKPDRESVESAAVTIVQNGGTELVDWTYTLAAPFATVSDGMSMEELLLGWQSGTNSIGRIILDSESAAILADQWGTPAESVRIVQPEELSSALWAGHPSWTVLPVHKLTSDLKILLLDGESPLQPEFDAASWPLKVTFGLLGNNDGIDKLLVELNFPESNFLPGHLTQIAMSGVTALGRATAFQMEIQGVTAPGKDVGEIMSGVDVAHISHEVAFDPDCPYPNPIGDPIFCARDKYLELLTAIGTDVVELTGNHLNDWGTDSLLHTLDLYENAGIEVYGGGRDALSAGQPALFEHNGNKIAFVGCNIVGPNYAWASADRPGSQPCSFPAFYDQIRTLKDGGYSVIATLQYYEYYHYEPTQEQRTDFRAIAEAGADAVSGSQGHHAQGFDFHNDAFIHFGLGNLFFDQMDMLGTRQSIIDVYSIYEGRIINIDLRTSLIENYCCPRIMTEEERTQLLESIFTASGW